MMRGTFVEKECCGIRSFGDIFSETRTTVNPNGTGPQLATLYRIPPSCCRQINVTACETWVEPLILESDFQANKTIFLNTRPCLNPGEGYESLKTTQTYQTYVKIIWSSVGVYVFVLGILAVLNYHIWIVFPKVPDNIRPVKFNQDVRNFMTFRWCKKRREEIKKRRSTWVEREEKTASEFKKRHELVKESLSNYRTTSREQKDKEQREKQLLAVKSSHIIMPISVAQSSNRTDLI